jgi:acyl-CoA thioesterase
MSERPPLPEILRLERTTDHTYAAPFEAPAPEHARDIVFGGQLLAQMIIASALDRDFTKEVKSIHAVFARPGTFGEPLVYDVDTMHDGRTFASDAVTCRQSGKVVARALILWTVDESDVVRHATAEMPPVAVPDAGTAGDGRVFPGAETVVVDESGASLLVWTRCAPVAGRRGGGALAPCDVPLHQAVLSWASDGYLIGAAMRPHGLTEAMAHRTISTGVVSHTINFHERFDTGEWLLLAHESLWAGRGRAYGRCNVFSADGRLVANYTQDSMIRAFADAAPAVVGERRRL